MNVIVVASKAAKNSNDPLLSGDLHDIRMYVGTPLLKHEGRTVCEVLVS